MTPNTTSNILQITSHPSPTKEENGTQGETNIIIVLYTLTIALGITGNSVVIWVAGFKLKPTVTNMWLVNLAVADLIFCMSISLSLIKKLFYNYWPFGEFLCKFNGFFKYANMFCSVFLLAVISIDRALCIWHPIITKNRRTLCAARLVSAVVWLVAIILSAPYFAYRQVFMDKNNLSKCSMEDENSTESRNLTLNSIRFLCGFLLPFIIILSCYILAALGIRRTRLSGKSRPLRILALLVCAFFLCWAPYHSFLLAKMVDRKSEVVKVGLNIAKAFAYFNSCINPLLYFCMGLNVRGSRFGRSIMGVYQRALAEDGDGRNTHSNERTVDKDTSGSASQPSMLTGHAELIKI
ncbi:fMet-Leu-Phe receptor-like isoform X1 [Esox lucius]|uniref:G-protein coupled receptors family 1 profile domain-containing protein n=1 Tax=Esox lucius TaxID=8010 RepID=A0A3P9ALE3_ESOLU|nr:fMet-Leu-Phe receptor-like isoform X1 [Esox lucius]